MHSTRILSSIGLSFTLMLSTLMQASTPVLEFGGEDSYVDLGTSAALQIDGNAPFTIEGWMYLNAFSTRDMLYSKSATRPTTSPYTYMFGFRDGLLAAYDGGSWRGDFDVSRETGRWYHLAFSFDGSVMRYYLDGTLIGQSVFSFSNTESHPIIIGGYHAASDIEGYKSDVRVWDHARDTPTIQIFMNYRLTGTEAGLLGYWPMNEGTGTQVFDATANATTGTVVNAVWTTTEDLNLESSYFPSLPFTLANQETGSTRFTNSNLVDLLELPIPEGYDHFQITEGGDPEDLGTWTFTNAVPETLEFPQPIADGEVMRYAWFTNTSESVALRRSQGSIIYTETGPDIGIVANLSRETAGFSIRISNFDIDAGSTGGTADGEPMEIYAWEALWDDGPHPDATPADPFVTLTNAGIYTVKLRVVNEAGNAALSTACTVTVTEAMAPPSDGDRFVVANNLNALAPHTNWATAAASIQDAVNAAAAGETVLVWPGRYTLPDNAVNWIDADNVVYLDKPLTIRSVGARENTIIDGEGVNRGIGVNYSGMTAHPLVFDSLTIYNCHTPSTGGGMRLSHDVDVNAQIVNCAFIDNHASSIGGGIHLLVARSLTISGSRFHGNTGSSGGGLHSSGAGALLLEGSTFEANTAVSGGAVTKSSGSLTIENCVFAGNTSTHSADGNTGGGALRLEQTLAVLRSSLFHQNTAHQSAVIYYHVSTSGWCHLEMYNCTVVNNTTVDKSGTAHVIRVRRAPSAPSIYHVFNSIVYGNDRANIVVPSGDSTDRILSHNCHEINLAAHGPGNITVPPLFVDAAANNYRLQRESPCINAGTNMTWMAGATDLDGNRRIDAIHNQVDMGAYEFQLPGTILFVR